ncbi:RidA family protein [Microbacterium hydrocarbonoxydans]|uniref:Enamine deaminase RidA, house cleaning of reactive enamine intermediates, YjgF/YER057c/UK114 family n=1 Tax=Microbacterium hydrocarbonoxydans TaxID=273678 RepID=A0A1H4JZF6_9MICO|nr:RidA family protein [Microbacterium hydrocarbonoxydans]SEB51689.1 Enamine deaminase RidA, house cleaning of reactive enamine intermediates, YjgF/YER057c/UK114 family [Microbacterium hydrocarbonoxydans]
MSISARLTELGIELPTVAAPVAAYVPAVVHDGLVYTSGQLPFTDGALPATGKVGAEVSAEDANAYARTCALNALAAAADAAGGVDRIAGVLRVGGFVASTPEFTGQPGVINGASLVLGEIFGDAGRHVRAAVGVPVLPLDSPVEVEVSFILA